MKRRLVVLCNTLSVVSVAVGLDGAAGGGVTLEVPQREVGKYQKLELHIDVGREYGNPFDPCEVEVNVLVEGPDGLSLSLPAFYIQDYERRDMDRGGRLSAWYYPVETGTWRARFAPTRSGAHTARVSLRDQLGQRFSAPATFQCRVSDGKGFVRAGRQDPRFLEFTDGSPFFVIGQNVAFVGPAQYVNVPKAETVFERLAENGANFVRIWTCCKDWALAIEARKSAWTRSWTRQSPVVRWPDGTDGPEQHKCVLLTGDDGASLAASPSHPVAVRPSTRYVFAGRVRTEGCRGVCLRVGNEQWDVSVPADDGPGWYAFTREFTTQAGAHWLGRISFSLIGSGRAWLDALSLKEADGSAELLWEADVNRPVRGCYNQLDCFMLDQLVEAAERNGIYLMLCLLTRDLYMEDLSKVGSREYLRATDDARKLMRYAVARWGYSTSVAAWEYFNEMDPGRPTDDFYREVGEYLQHVDVYGHLRTTSTWHPSARDCRHRQLDIAQEHHYMRPNDDDVKDAVRSIIAQTRFLREHAPNKPALIGEFGLATTEWGLSDYMKQDTKGVHLHNCLWASAFAGSSGTAMFWWWDQLDRQDAYRHYAPLSAYLKDVSFAGLRELNATTSHNSVRALGYQGDRCAYFWLFNERAAWWNLVVESRQPEAIQAATVEIGGFQPGHYSIEWWDTQGGVIAEAHEAQVRQDVLKVDIPTFSHDIACKIRGL